MRSIMFTEDSSSDTSSERSLSPSPPSLSYSSAFANPIKIPLKSCLSPPSTTSSDFSSSPLTPPTPPSSSVSPQTVICAYPSWPAGDFLSSQPSTFSHVTDSRGTQPSSRISDDDLLGLEELELFDGVRVPTSSTISWEATKQPPVIIRSTSKRPSAGGKKRRTSAPYRKRSMKAMSPILEGPE
ncbi:MAG: hypothetical protein L6R41_006704 [Letrouitia leprolyta]|nr:MAG: hypothetical protein L6R41_006704 [Letrouitia leprolyta]